MRRKREANLRPRTQLTIKLDKAKVKKIAKENQMTPQQLVMLIEPILNETLERTMEDMTIWILRFVPKRTGQLRVSLLDNMKSSRVKNGVLRFIIGTHLDYATRVNKMSTSQVRHKGTWYEHPRKKRVKWYKKKKTIKRRAYAYYYGHYGRIFLDDPEAVGGFWFALLTYLKLRILFHMKNAMLKQYGKTQLPWVIN